MANDQKDPLAKLTGLLGTDVRKVFKEGSPTLESFKKVIENREKAKADKLQAKAEEQFNKIAEVVDQGNKLDREYKKAREKLDSELTKLVEQIARAANGDSGQEGGESHGSAPAADAPANTAPPAAT